MAYGPEKKSWFSFGKEKIRWFLDKIKYPLLVVTAAAYAAPVLAPILPTFAIATGLSFFASWLLRDRAAPGSAHAPAHG